MFSPHITPYNAQKVIIDFISSTPNERQDNPYLEREALSALRTTSFAKILNFFEDVPGEKSTDRILTEMIRSLTLENQNLSIVPLEQTRNLVFVLSGSLELNYSPSNHLNQNSIQSIQQQSPLMSSKTKKPIQILFHEGSCIFPDMFETFNSIRIANMSSNHEAQVAVIPENDWNQIFEDKQEQINEAKNKLFANFLPPLFSTDTEGRNESLRAMVRNSWIQVFEDSSIVYSEKSKSNGLAYIVLSGTFQLLKIPDSTEEEQRTFLSPAKPRNQELILIKTVNTGEMFGQGSETDESNLKDRTETAQCISEYGLVLIIDHQQIKTVQQKQNQTSNSGNNSNFFVRKQFQKNEGIGSNFGSFNGRNSMMVGGNLSQNNIKSLRSSGNSFIHSPSIGTPSQKLHMSQIQNQASGLNHRPFSKTNQQLTDILNSKLSYQPQPITRSSGFITGSQTLKNNPNTTTIGAGGDNNSFALLHRPKLQNSTSIMNSALNSITKQNSPATSNRDESENPEVGVGGGGTLSMTKIKSSVFRARKYQSERSIKLSEHEDNPAAADEEEEEEQGFGEDQGRSSAEEVAQFSSSNKHNIISTSSSSSRRNIFEKAGDARFMQTHSKQLFIENNSNRSGKLLNSAADPSETSDNDYNRSGQLSISPAKRPKSKLFFNQSSQQISANEIIDEKNKEHQNDPIGSRNQLNTISTGQLINRRVKKHQSLINGSSSNITSDKLLSFSSTRLLSPGKTTLAPAAFHPNVVAQPAVLRQSFPAISEHSSTFVSPLTEIKQHRKIIAGQSTLSPAKLSLHQRIGSIGSLDNFENEGKSEAISTAISSAKFQKIISSATSPNLSQSIISRASTRYIKNIPNDSIRSFGKTLNEQKDYDAENPENNHEIQLDSPSKESSQFKGVIGLNSMNQSLNKNGTLMSFSKGPFSSVSPQKRNLLLKQSITKSTQNTNSNLLSPEKSKLSTASFQQRIELFPTRSNSNMANNQSSLISHQQIQSIEKNENNFNNNQTQGTTNRQLNDDSFEMYQEYTNSTIIKPEEVSEQIEQISQQEVPSPKKPGKIKPFVPLLDLQSLSENGSQINNFFGATNKVNPKQAAIVEQIQSEATSKIPLTKILGGQNQQNSSIPFGSVSSPIKSTAKIQLNKSQQYNNNINHYESQVDSDKEIIAENQSVFVEEKRVAMSVRPSTPVVKKLNLIGLTEKIKKATEVIVKAKDKDEGFAEIKQSRLILPSFSITGSSSQPQLVNSSLVAEEIIDPFEIEKVSSTKHDALFAAPKTTFYQSKNIFSSATSFHKQPAPFNRFSPQLDADYIKMKGISKRKQ